MGNYNPKTAYQFRWQDAKNLQKFIQGQIVVKDVNLAPTDPTVYNFNTVPEAKELAETVKYCLENNIPMIIYDEVNQYIWFSDILTDGEAHFFNANYNIIKTLFLDIYDDHIEVNYSFEEILSADNVKTLFGTESIIGTGNIDLFNHFLTVTASDGSKLYINYPSSNNLECDSLQDLTKMTKAVNGTKIGFGSTYINYNGSIWQTANSTAITAVSDVVTTL